MNLCNDILGVNRKITSENLGQGSAAFTYRKAHGFVVGFQSDLKKFGFHFITTSSTWSPPQTVIFEHVVAISGELRLIYNSQGSISYEDTDSGTTCTIYYLEIN